MLRHRVHALAARDGGETVQRVLAGDIGEQIPGQILDARYRANAAPAHDVLVEDRIPEGSQIVATVHVSQQRLRVAAIRSVTAQLLDQLRTGACSGDGAQGFGEGERKQDDGKMPSRQMSSELAAQQVGVAPGQNQPESLSLEAIGEQFPPWQFIRESR